MPVDPVISLLKVMRNWRDPAAKASCTACAILACSCGADGIEALAEVQFTTDYSYCQHVKT